MSKHKTARGKEFNMQIFATNNGDKIAVGNTNRNARGDLIGAGGKIIATAQNITNKAYDQSSARGNVAAPKINPMEQEVNRKVVVGADGMNRWEVTYADGSVEIVEDSSLNKPEPKSKSKAKSEPVVDMDNMDTTFVDDELFVKKDQ